MKKIVLSIVVAGSMAFGAGYGDAGCGLGSVVMGSDGNQVLASTTNGTVANQLSGMTSGTSNCKKEIFASNNREMFKFIEQNMDAIAIDISKGEGEYLNTMALYLKMDSKKLGVKLKANFDNIYTKDDIKVSEVMENIDKVILNS